MSDRDTRTLKPAAQEALRIRAVQAVQGGMTQTRAAEVFGVARQSVNRWVARARGGGERALEAQKRGRPKGAGRLLKPWQAGVVVRLIKDRHPDQLKLPFALWTRDGVRQLIKERFGVSASPATVGRWLARWGFTPQKPARRAWERNPEAVERWLARDYPAIERQAKREKARIHWGDETGMRSDHQAGRTYGLRGQTPVVPGPGKRFSCNMISSVTNRGDLRFMVFQGGFTAKVFIEFLGRLVRGSEQKIFLILDNHAVHRSKAVREWIAKRRKRIRLFFLPPYSPELNPDELLNNDVKSNAVGRRRASCGEELMSNVRSYLHSTQKRPSIVENFFHAPRVRYAARNPSYVSHII